MNHTEKYLFTKSAFLGIGKALESSGVMKKLVQLGLHPKQIMELSKHTAPRTGAIGAGVGGLGNVMLGDEDQSITERLLKGLLYGGLGGAAAGVPLAAAGSAGSMAYARSIKKMLDGMYSGGAAAGSRLPK